MAQVVGNRHPLQLGLAAGDLQRVLVEGDVERDRRAIPPLHQGVGLHHLVGQHGDLVAGHVHRGQAGAAQHVHRAAGLHGQAGRGDVNTHGHGAGAQALHAQGVVNFGSLRIVNREGLHGSHRQLVRNGRCGNCGKAGALGEVLQQKALPVEQVGRGNRTGLLQQLQRRNMGGAAGFDYGFVFGGVFVRLEQDLVQLVLDGLRAGACRQLLSPLVDLLSNQALLLNGGQRLRNDVGGRLLEAALAGAAEIVRRVKQLEQHAGLLGLAGLGREIVFGEIGKAKLFVGGKFVGHVQLDACGLRLGGGHKISRGGLFELDQHVGRLDLDALAGIQLHLCRGFCLGQDATGHEFSGFFKQYKHRGWIVPAKRVVPNPPAQASGTEGF